MPATAGFLVLCLKPVTKLAWKAEILNFPGGEASPWTWPGVTPPGSCFSRFGTSRGWELCVNCSGCHTVEVVNAGVRCRFTESGGYQCFCHLGLCDTRPMNGSVCQGIDSCISLLYMLPRGKLHIFDEKVTRLLWEIVYNVYGYCTIIRPSATISKWTAFPIGCCNCTIQDGVQDGRRGFASTLQKDTNLFPIT